MKNWIVPLFLVVSSVVWAGPVHQGRLELTSGNPPVALDGAWQFWARSLPDEGRPAFLEVPGTWNATMGGADGWGVYRLTVQVPADLTDLALLVPTINSASTILWNGQPVWTSGTWATARQAFVPLRKTGVVVLKPQVGDNLLEIRAASWGDINAGLTEQLKIGPLAALGADRSADINLSVFLFGCLFIMGVYHFGLFGYRPSDRGPLWFGFLAVLLGLRGLIYGASPLADFVPSLDWEAMMKLGYLTFSASTLFFGLFLTSLFPQVIPRWFLPTVLIGAGGYSVGILALPAAWYSPALPVFQAYAAFVGVVIGVLLFLAAGQGLRGARLFLVGFVLFFAAVLNDILKTHFFLPTPNLSSLGLLVFLVFQSLVMLKQFTSAYAASETYTRSLTRINTALGRFIPGAVLGFLDKQSIVDVELGDHCERSMAVMFADIRDFTRLSESMSPEENFRFINSYLRRMGPVVRRHEGFVDKYLGDGILALFPGQARQALDAALDLRIALSEYNGHRAKSGYPAIRMGIGIHWGPLMLGTIGENERMDSTVISDTVNAASRLEGLTKKFLHDVLVSEETVEALGDAASRYQLKFLDEETVKGRTRPLRVYAVSALTTIDNS